MSFNEKLSYTEHNVVSPTSDFTIGFEDYALTTKDRINVTVDDVDAIELGYTVTRKNNLVVTLTPPVASGVVRLQRETNIDTPFHRFTAGAKFVATNVDQNFTQILHSQQEVRNLFGFTQDYIQRTLDNFDLRIQGVEGIVLDLRQDYNNLDKRITKEVGDRKQGDQELKEYIDTVVNGVTGEVFLPIHDEFVITESGRTQRERNRDWVSVKDYGAKGDGVTDDTVAFNLAAATGKNILVPKTDASYLISSATDSAMWIIENGALINGLNGVGYANAAHDTSRLTGSVINYNAGGLTDMRIGDSDPWLSKSIRTVTDQIATQIVASPHGQIGGLFYSRSSDDPTPNMSTIGMSSYGVNDNITNPEPTWSTYLEAVRFKGAGCTFGMESDFINLGNTYNLTPYSAVDPYSATNAPTVNIWLSTGGGDTSTSPLASVSNNSSAAITLLPNNAKFNRGIVVRDNSIETQEIIAAPLGYKYAWHLEYDGSVNSFIDHRHIYQTVISDSTVGTACTSRKFRTNKPTATGDIVHTHLFFASAAGYATSTSEYRAGYHQVVQKSSFSGGAARFAMEWGVTNPDGGFTTVALNYSTSASFSPTTDGAVTNGAPSNRWNTIYASTGTINTSDERLKQQFRSLHEAEKACALEIKNSICLYKFNDAVDLKGDGARWHCGVKAQEVISIMKDHGLNPFDYGFICFDEWESQEEIVDGDKVVQEFVPAGNRYAVRYDELAMFILASM